MNDNSRIIFDYKIKKQYKAKIISGSDEAGRGAMAGPIVVATVILKPGYRNPNINDSKKLSPHKREELFNEIINNSLDYKIKVYDNNFVDKNNPKATSKIGMTEGIHELKVKPDLALLDAEKLISDDIPYLSLIKGDTKSQSIAAASILAKHYRDNLMINYAKKYQYYGFEIHKGYCTQMHYLTLAQYGVSPIHRKSYKPVKAIMEVDNMFDRTNKEYLEWINTKNLDLELKTILESATDEELNAAFNIKLEFGTAGIRGVLGAGPGRFNIYTIRKVTMAYAKLLQKKYEDDDLTYRGVVIGHDNRHNSKRFAQEVADILTSFGIKAYLFKDNIMKPTPVVSFATKDLNCIGGIVITASHNPAMYNGYKIYDEYGCQLIDIDTKVIASNMEEIKDILTWDYKKDDNCLITVPEKTLDNYKKMISNLQFYPNDDRQRFTIIYSGVNGTGNEFTPGLLTSFGYKVDVVKEHAFEDETFKNVVNPNPEFDPAWKIPFEYGERNKDASLIVIQDPDADRIGIAVQHEGKWIRLDGNQTGPILIEWKLSQLKKQNKMPENPALYSSFVTSNLGDRIAKETYGVNIIKTLTGFKWMGSEILKEKERGYNFVFAYEESYGYVLDSSTRDKDGIQAATMLVEAAWYYKKNFNKTLFDVLNDIFDKYGYYYTYTENLNFKPEEVKSKVEPIMKKLREESFTNLGNLKVDFVEDYIDGLHNMPGQNLLKFYFEDGSWLAVRPSGTEPKIKIYFISVDKNIENAKEKCTMMFNKLKEFLNI